MEAIAEIPVATKHSALTYDQVFHYMEHGYVVVSGLISKEIAARADEAAYRVVKLDPHDPETWKNANHSTFSEDPALMAMYTPEVRTAAAQLASSDPHLFSMSRVPENAYILTVKPTNDEWKTAGPHIDGLGNWQCIIQSFPRPWTMFAMLYIHDVGRHEGATVVYPGTQRKYQAMMRANPEKYRFLCQVADDFKKIDIGEPVELQAKAGDVAFIDQMLVHAGTINNGKRPRFAMNMKW